MTCSGCHKETPVVYEVGDFEDHGERGSRLVIMGELCAECVALTEPHPYEYVKVND